MRSYASFMHKGVSSKNDAGIKMHHGFELNRVLGVIDVMVFVLHNLLVQ
jgi:hypothetical protein